MCVDMSGATSPEERSEIIYRLAVRGFNVDEISAAIDEWSVVLAGGELEEAVTEQLEQRIKVAD